MSDHNDPSLSVVGSGQKGSSVLRRPDRKGQVSVNQHLRGHDSIREIDPSGLASHAPFSVVDEKPNDFTPLYLFPTLDDLGDTEVRYGIETLEVSQIPLNRSSVKELLLPQNCYDRRVSNRLGSS